jgi:hypothetical protein
LTLWTAPLVTIVMLLTHTQLPAQKELSELLLEQLPLEIVLHVLQEKYAHKQD